MIVRKSFRRCVRLFQHRSQFEADLVNIDEALDKAAGLAGPICLLDMGDNAGGGAPADGTLLAQAMHDRGLARAFACLYDPESVAAAEAAGAGNRAEFRVGGKSDNLHGPPLTLSATVIGLYDGKFEEPQPRHGGFTKMDQGRTAVIRTDAGLTLMLTSRRMPPFSLRQLTTFDVNPADYHLLVAKGVNAPVGAYKEVCRNFIRVNTPGSTTADLSLLTYHHRRKPMYPFERDMEWKA